MTHSGPKTRPHGETQPHWMWRISSVLLLTLWTLLVTAPLAQAQQDLSANLPACCRTHGAHHCAGNAAQPGDSPTLAPATLQEKCPCTPASSPGTLSGAATLAASASFADPTPATSDLCGSTGTPRRRNTSHANPKRGPPSLGLLL